MKKITKNTFSPLILFLSFLFLPFLVIGCSTKNKTYDFGITTNTINNLNYVNDLATKQILPNIVQGLLYTTTEDKLIRSRMNLDKEVLNWNYYSIENNGELKLNAVLQNSLTKPLDLFGISYGSLVNDANFAANFLTSKENDDIFFVQDSYAGAFILNKKHKWANGDYVQPKDYVDYLKYVFDINSGSQQLKRLLETNIKNANNFYDAQIKYQSKFGTSYKDPWGYKNGWESQNKNDNLERAEIEKNAKNFGVFTGKQFKENLENSKVFWESKDLKTKKINESKKKFYQKIIKDANEKKGYKIDQRLFYDVEVPFDFFSNLTNQNIQLFYPINRKFVESIGGIGNFGNSLENFLGNSYYQIEDMQFSKGGYVILKKDPKYFKSGWTLTDKIKIFFENDPNVSSSLFKDNYLSYTKIPSDYLPIFWSDKKLRMFMKKNQGQGTQAIQLNLEKSRKSPLNDVNLRRAISFFINRKDIASVAKNNYGTIVNKFSTIGIGKTKDGITGIPIEDFYENENYQPYSGSKTFPIQNFKYSDQLSIKNAMFENSPRKDQGHDKEIGDYFLNEYKKKNPNVKSVKLDFIFNTNNESELEVGLYLRNILKIASNGFIDLYSKGFSNAIYDSMRKSGKFDLAFFNFDFYGTSVDGNIKRFDELDELAKNKKQGFFKNPSGSWTYKKWLNSLNTNQIQDVKKRLNISEDNWVLIKQIIEDKRKWDFKFIDITNGFPDEKTFKIIVDFEKIIRDQVPLIPVFEVDNYWSISKIKADSLYIYNLQLAYEMTNKPLSWLPDI